MDGVSSKRDDLSAYDFCIDERPVIGRPFYLAYDGLGLVPGGVMLPSCQNCSIKRTH
jgi:hypothetical protein